MKHVTFRQLKVFESVARHLSFSRAAEELHLTQPAVSMQVRQLEESIGLPLTEQVGKKIYLTAAGAEMARQSRLIAQQLRAASESMGALRGVRGGLLNVCVVTTAQYFAPRLIAMFLKRHPGVDLRLGVNNREDVVHQLHENEIDLAIMGQPPQEFPTISEPFAEHPLVIIAAPEHPLAHHRHIELEQLALETFVIREPGSGTRSAMELYFAEHAFTPRATLEMSSNETIKQAVMAGIGIAFLSAHTVGLELKTRRLVRLDVVGTPVLRQWFTVQRADKRPLPLASAFIAFLHEEAPRMLPGESRKKSPPLAQQLVQAIKSPLRAKS